MFFLELLKYKEDSFQQQSLISYLHILPFCMALV